MKNLAQYLLLAVAPALITAQNNCTVFNWDQQPGYLRQRPDLTPTQAGNRRVSAAATCANTTGADTTLRNNTFCPLHAGGDEQIFYSYNISNVLQDSIWLTPDRYQTSFLLNTVKTAVNGTLNGEVFNTSIVGAVDTTQLLSPGQSGYIHFTPYLRCFVGTMSNCTGNVTERIPIEMCAGVAYRIKNDATSSKLVLAGEYDIVNVSAATVDSYTDPYANQNAGASAGAGTALEASLLTSFLGLVAVVALVM